MKFHELKIKQEYLDAVKSGIKPFEIRKNDRDFQVGDIVNFKVVHNDLVPTNMYSIRELQEKGFTVVERNDPSTYPMKSFEVTKADEDVYQITYVLKDVPQYGLHKDYCIFGLKKLEAK